MSMRAAKKIFKEHMGDSRNFMTPTVLAYHKRGPFVVELSSGRGFDGGMIYGVTVVHQEEGHVPHLSECFTTAGFADDYINGLGNITGGK